MHNIFWTPCTLAKCFRMKKKNLDFVKTVLAFAFSQVTVKFEVLLIKTFPNLIWLVCQRVTFITQRLGSSCCALFKNFLKTLKNLNFKSQRLESSCCALFTRLSVQTLLFPWRTPRKNKGASFMFQIPGSQLLGKLFFKDRKVDGVKCMSFYWPGTLRNRKQPRPSQR